MHLFIIYYFITYILCIAYIYIYIAIMLSLNTLHFFNGSWIYTKILFKKVNYSQKKYIYSSMIQRFVARRRGIFLCFFSSIQIQTKINQRIRNIRKMKWIKIELIDEEFSWELNKNFKFFSKKFSCHFQGSWSIGLNHFFFQVIVACSANQFFK